MSFYYKIHISLSLSFFLSFFLINSIFDDKKFVEVYTKDSAEKLGLGYNEKVALAMLLGGDYTEGVRGVGIVSMKQNIIVHILISYLRFSPAQLSFFPSSILVFVLII
jgi:hypothetical protein